VGGIPDIVTDGVSGLLVPPDDADKAAAALEMLVNQPEMRARLSDVGRQHKEDYDWSVIALEYASQYEALCSQPGA
jgi:glycosyltransferase involved in cell wall biosynthesis